MTDFGKAVAALLKREYPQARILDRETESAGEGTVFILLPQKISLRREMGRRWRREEMLVLYYYPEKGKSPESGEQPLLSLLAQAARGVRAEPQLPVSAQAEREKKYLQIILSLSQILFMDEEEAALMKQMILHMGEEMEKRSGNFRL